MKDPLQPTRPQQTPSSPPATGGPLENEGLIDLIDIDTDDEFGSEFDHAAEDLPPLNLDNIPDEKPPKYSFSESFPPLPTSSTVSTVSTLLASPSPSQLQHPLGSGLQSQSRVTQGHAQPTAPGTYKPQTCVVCRLRPVYEHGGRTYPTCGKKCAQKLESNQSTTSDVMKGHMSNPQNASSRFPSVSLSFPNIWSSNSEAGSSSSSSSTRQIKMCEVCRLRPKHQRGGKIYPTCGLTCAAKLQAPGTVEMCNFCKKRPKVVINGKVFPQCGKTCRDNAKLAMSAAINSATCTSCLICWKATKTGDSSDYCSPVCEAAAESRAPYLIEVPRGHVAFKKVADTYMEGWKTTGRTPRRIKKIFMVKMKSSSFHNFEQYRSRVNGNVLGLRKKGNEQRGWLGLTRECGFGDPGNMDPCSSSSCLLCCIVRSAVVPDKFPDGIIATGSLPRATDTASASGRNRASNVVLLAKVLLGKIMERSDLIPPVPPNTGYNTVHLVAYTRTGTKLDYQEYVVFDGNAIQPLYLISFE